MRLFEVCIRATQGFLSCTFRCLHSPSFPLRYHYLFDLQDVKEWSFTAHGGTSYLNICLNSLENVIRRS